MRWLVLLAVGCNADPAVGNNPPDGGNPPDGSSLPDLAGPRTYVDGVIGGSPFAAADAIFTDVVASGFDFNGISYVTQVSTFGAACNKEAANAGVANGRLLDIAFAVNDAAGMSHLPAAFVPGEVFNVTKNPSAPSSNQAEVFYTANGADCRRTQLLQADSGSVTLTTGEGGYGAKFDLTFGREHITGQFLAQPCAAFNPNRTPLDSCM